MANLNDPPAAPAARDPEAEVARHGLRPIAGGKAEVQEETFEVDLTDAEPTDEAPEAEADKPPVETPEAKAEAEAAETPAKPAEAATAPPAEPARAEPPKPAEKKPEAKAEPEPERPRERLHPAVHEERAKRKEYARLYAEANARADAAEQQLRLLRAAPTAADDPELKKWYDELAAEADKSTSMSDVFKVAVREMDRRDRARVRELNAQIYSLRCDLSETRARGRHADWEAAIQKAGLFEAIRTDAQGQFHDPAMARRIYYLADGSLATDPAERMYRLAVGKLEYEREQRGEPDPEDAAAATRAGAAQPTEATAEPKPTEAEAERRGAQRVIEQVAKASTRPRGLRGIPKAEGPVKMTRQQLDRMLDEDPESYERLVRRNPAIERFHLGG